MWLCETVSSIELVVDFLNDQRLRPEQCKVVAAHGDEGDQIFHVLYRLGDPVLAEVAAAQAEQSPGPAVDTGDALDAAEAIIADAQRDE